MSQFFIYSPLVTGGLVVGSVMIASGSSLLQASIAGVATGVTGLTTSALIAQSQFNKQKLIEEERDRLKLEIRNQRELVSLKIEIENLQRLGELFHHSIHEFKQYDNSLDETKHTTLPSQESSISLYSKITVKHNGEEFIETISRSGNNVKIILDFLERRNIKIKTIRAEDVTDDLINSLIDKKASLF